MHHTEKTLAEIGCGAVVGVDAIPVVVQASIRSDTDGAPRILGSVDAVVREAYHRVLGAFRAQGLPSPRGAPVLNFVPAEVRKTGAGFDLPMALALAAADGFLPRERVAGCAAFGEVTLDGSVRPVPGIVPVALAIRERGWTRLLAHPDDARRAAVVPGIEPVGVASLRDAVLGLAVDASRLPRPTPSDALAALLQLADRGARLDLADLRGLRTPKQALAVAAAGRHDVLFIGPPGCGKSALLRRVGDLLPPLVDEDCLEILKIHSILGVDATLARSGRPFRAPHHSSSAASVLGGGTDPRPGEVTLAQHGVLFLDELPEFRREVLEGLRQPLEERRVTIGRVRRTVTLPADFLLVAAMNPCPCGHAGDPGLCCRCTPAEQRRYRARVSGPLLDRIDLRVEVPALPPEAFREPADDDLATAAIRQRVETAAARQRGRNPDRTPNGRLDGPALEAAFGDSAELRRAVDDAMRTLSMSGRGRVRVMRIARTIADLDDRDLVTAADVRRAVRLRAALSA